jgi:hypothetical protein
LRDLPHFLPKRSKFLLGGPHLAGRDKFGNESETGAAGIIERLRARDVNFYDWPSPGTERKLVRLVTSFATPEADMERLLEIARH